MGESGNSILPHFTARFWARLRRARLQQYDAWRWLKSTSAGAIGPANATGKPFESNRLCLVKQMQWVIASKVSEGSSMQRISQIAIVFLTASSLALAQTPGWRHIGDPAPAPADPQAQAQNPMPGAAGDQQNPEPVAQPDQQEQPATAPATAPAPATATSPTLRPVPPLAHPIRPAYGLPAELTVKPGTYVSVRINQALSTDHNQAGDPFTAAL